MPKLTATYKVPLSGSVRLQRDKEDTLEYITAIGDFIASLRIIPDPVPKLEAPGGLPITVASQVQISVSRDEPEDPPPTSTNDYGGRNFLTRAEWISARQGDYDNVALTIANRLISFLRYIKGNSRLTLLRKYDNAFSNPFWTNSGGERVEPGINRGTAEFMGFEGPELLGEKALSKTDDNALSRALQTDFEPTPAQDFLADARASINAANYRRAVLEMAIACEVAIKQAFFKASTPAGSAFEYLEDKGKVRVSAIDLLHGPSVEAFSESFRNKYPTDYQHLDHLFRCRNKVAHRAIGQYRDDDGVLHSVDRKNLGAWWHAIENLFQWLQSKTGHSP